MTVFVRNMPVTTVGPGISFTDEQSFETIRVNANSSYKAFPSNRSECDQMSHFRPRSPWVFYDLSCYAYICFPASWTIVTRSIASMCGPIGAGIGAVFSVIALFIPQPDPSEMILEKLKEGFDKMHERFDKLELKLDQLEFNIEKTAVYQMYKENQDRIHKVMFAHRQLFMNPSEDTLREFTDMCRIENPLYALEWIHRRSLESRGPFGLQLFLTILKDIDYDRKKLAQFYEVITSDIMTAAYLREACLGAQSPGNTRLIWKNRRVMGNLLTGITQTMKYFETRLATSFKNSRLEQELQELLDASIESETKPAQIVIDVKSVLKEKYFWLDWNVYLVKTGAFDITDGGDDHYATVGGKYKGKDHTLILIWSEPNALIKHEVDYCRKTYERDYAIQMANGLQVNFGGLSDPAYMKRLNIFFKDPQGFYEKAQHLWHTTYYEATYFRTVPDLRDNKVALIVNGEILANATDAITCDLRIARKPYRTIMAYYKSTSIPNSFGCSATQAQLEMINVTRMNVCPSKAMQEAVRVKVKKHLDAHRPVNGQQLTDNDDQSWADPDDSAADDQELADTAVVKKVEGLHLFNANEAAKSVHDILSKSYQDFEWTVVTRDHANPGSFVGCNSNKTRIQYEFQNCTWLNTTAYTFVITWSLGTDKLIQKQLSEAEEKLKFLQALYDQGLIFNSINTTEDLTQHIHDLITDPLLYFMYYRVSEEKITDLIRKNQLDFTNLTNGMPLNPENFLHYVNFYENKVITVGQTSVTKSNSDMITFTLNPPSDRKHIQAINVTIIYYKPFEMANTLHCTASEKEYNEADSGDRELIYGC